MESANPTFARREIQLESPDLAAIGLTSFLQHPDLVIVEDNGPGGALNGAPIVLIVERHIRDEAATTVAASLTFDELVTLRNFLNEAIVFVERTA